MCADGHVGIGHPGLDQLESRIGSLVDDLCIFLVERDVDFEELDIELQLLLNLRLRDVEVLAFVVWTADQTGIVALCYFKNLSRRYRLYFTARRRAGISAASASSVFDAVRTI